MTSKSLFFRLMKEDLKRRLWAFGLSFLTFFFSMPVLAAMGITNLEQQYALWVEDAGNYDFGAGNTAETEFSRRLGELAVESIGLENVVMGFLVITAALVLALTGFLYLHSRKQVDFYHSIPVRREILFTVRFVDGILVIGSMYLVNLLLANMPNMLASGWGASNSDRTAALSAANPGAILPKGPFAALFGNSSWINISIIITILFAILVWVILQKTTFGYELKACGLSRDAAQYAGINSKRNIVLSMVISGALSGIGGAIYYLAGTGQYVLEKSILGMGFNGIPVALLASSNPIGTIFAALFISYIQVGGAAMQPAYSSETIDIVIAVIIYLAAFALLMRGVIAKAVSGRKEKGGAAK